jgi:hypothetical protein
MADLNIDLSKKFERCRMYFGSSALFMTMLTGRRGDNYTYHKFLNSLDKLSDGQRFFVEEIATRQTRGETYDRDFYVPPEKNS